MNTQSQSGATLLTADKAIDISSTQGEVSITALTSLLLTAGGAAVDIQAGNITLTAPGKIEFKGAVKVFAGPKSLSQSVDLAKPAKLSDCALKLASARSKGAALVS